MREENKNSCYCYLRIVGDFDPREVTDFLGLAPARTRDIKKLMKEPHPNPFSSWETEKCHDLDDDLEVSRQMMRVIAPFLDKTDKLRYIHDNLGASIYLVVVPELYSDTVLPVLSPSLEVMDFCHEARCEFDMDIYIMG